MPTKIYIDEITSELEEWNYDDSDGGIFELNSNEVTIKDLDSNEIVKFNLNDMEWEEDNGIVNISKKGDEGQYINFEISVDQEGGSYSPGITLASFLRLLNLSKSEQGGGKKKKKKSKKRTKKRTKKKKSKKSSKKKKSKKRTKKKKSKKKTNQKGVL